MGGFPFDKLPIELALGVIRFAAYPTYSHPSSSTSVECRSPKFFYRDALALSLTSYNFRRVCMPHLLSTVILSNDTDVKRFVETLHIQRRHHLTSSRLSVDYQKYVRRLWMSECCGILENSRPEDDIEYDELLSLLRNADIGFNIISIGVFCTILGSTTGRSSYSMEGWPAKKTLTLCGSFLRWRPLASTCEGNAFLKTITHLILWVSYTNKQDGDELALVHGWFKNIPFELMPNLSHFAVSLPHRPGYSVTRMLVYQIKDKELRAEIIREWGLSSDPFKHGAIVPIQVNQRAGEEDWEDAYFHGEEDAVWAAVDSLST